ncbi:hypothetical protein G5V58_18525 [Nocardioides anomalus]|uniref:YCII-related domain-containing protein n=1 Tax=Nocardioides anomalus TaxID=2712223 RepID=A0A6G6WHH2_9ACTN|nr:YciI family protein [Nocardioides anomalus]QIG44510.1 hypothetical protein G5V58_18525 [Nocardioides anomalus]
MPQYVVFSVDDEDQWERSDDATRQQTYDADERFLSLLKERGGKVVGGADLTHSREGRVLVAGDDGMSVTEGPYAESVEQLTGFYIVEAADLETVVDAARLMLEGHGRLEIRPRPDRDYS